MNDPVVSQRVVHRLATNLREIDHLHDLLRKVSAGTRLNRLDNEVLLLVPDHVMEEIYQVVGPPGERTA